MTVWVSSAEIVGQIELEFSLMGKFAGGDEICWKIWIKRVAMMQSFEGSTVILIQISVLGAILQRKLEKKGL